MSNSEFFDNKKNNNNELDEQYLDSFLEKVEKEMSSIEMQEFVNGITVEELEEKGFIGNKDIEIKRPVLSGRITESGIEFEKGIIYAEKKGNNISEIKLESVQYLPDIQAGLPIAYKKISLDENNNASSKKDFFKNETYLKSSNIDIKVDKDKAVFVSKIKGKVILFNSIPYVIPSDKDGYCSVKISPDRMQVMIDIFPGKGNGNPVSYEMIMEELKKRGVINGILRSDIYDYIDKVQSTGIELTDLLIAEGKNPVDGKDAVIEYFFKKNDKTIDDFSILPDGRIDYHKKANISMVKKGDTLAKIGTPTKGTDGYNVFGQVLKAKGGNNPVIIAGENVRISKDEKEFFAECNGQVSLNSNVINVFKHYYVDGDVDYGTGNIDFNGNLTIKGTILEGFEVKASGDIVVFKNIESANVNSGRDLKIFGGILCRKDGNNLISCGRDLFVNHLQNAKVETQRNIYIGNSCVQSTVYCNGKMYLQKQKGVVIGGNVNALCGIDAKNIGTEFGTKTEIIVGNDFLVQKTAREFRKVLGIYIENLKKIDNVILPLMKLIKSNLAISMEKRNRLLIIIEKRKQIKKNKEIMEWKLKDIEERIHGDITATVKVSDTIFSGVTVRIKDRMKVTIEPYNHVTIYYDNHNDKLGIAPY